MKAKIVKFGFEIEGEFSRELMGKLIYDGKVKGDGSVSWCERNTKWGRKHAQRMWDRRHANIDTTAEFASNPFEYSMAGVEKAKQIFKLFDEAWSEQGYHYNKSAGFHIHISFKPKLPIDCWSSQFILFFLKRLHDKFPKVWTLRSKNSYCKAHTFSQRAHEELISSNPSRYRAVNVVAAFRRHKTIEFRIWPADRPKKMFRYLVFTLKSVDYFLKHSKMFLTETTELELESEDITRNIEHSVIIHEKPIVRNFEVNV